MVSVDRRSGRRRGTAPFAAAVGLAMLLGGCSSSTAPDEPAYVERPADDLYNQALNSLQAGDTTEAAQSFAEVERQHPYSPWATRAQLMAAYADYKGGRYDDAIDAVDRFVRLHPGNENLDYAYYLKALAYYDRISDVERDQKMTEDAKTALEDVIRRFPGTDYARDAQLKLDLTLDQLAGKEMTIGRYYLRQGQYNAAINRFKTVIDNYQTTTHVPEALHRLTEGYLALGLVDEARASASVLGHNFPGSPWYLDSYADLVDPSVRPHTERSFWQRATGWLF